MSERIIPDKVQVEVHVSLPPEGVTLLRDLHEDRSSIAIGGCVLLGCLLCITYKFLTRKGA